MAQTVFELLKADHKKVKGLFEQVEEENDAKKLKELVRQISKELAIHTAIEEQYFYPALENADPTRARVLEAYEEHKGVTEKLDEIQDEENEIEVEALKVMIKIAQELVEHHVKEEEEELFPESEKILSLEEQQSLAEKMSAEKEEQMSSTKI